MIGGAPSLNDLPRSPTGKSGWPWTETSPLSPDPPDRCAWPRVTVVTPSYNQAQFLEETLRSVLLQGYPDLEYVVLDGGSRDRSADIVRRYAPWLAHWASEADGGQTAAINAGWRRATGEIVAYLNSDDLYMPGTVARAVEFLSRHPDVAIVYGACRIVNELSEPVGGPRAMVDASFAALLRYPLPQPTMFVRRSVLDRIGFLDASLHCTMDWEFTLRAARAGLIIEAIPGPPLAAARVWPGAKTSNLFERCVEEALAIRDRLLADPSLPPALAAEVAFTRAWALLWPAYEYYVRGEMRVARRLLHRAVATRRDIVRRGEFLGLYARTLLGRRGSRAARLLKARLEANARLRPLVGWMNGSAASGWRAVSEPAAERRHP